VLEQSGMENVDCGNSKVRSRMNARTVDNNSFDSLDNECMFRTETE